MDEKAKRTRHGQAFWLNHIVACEQSGSGVLAYLREHGLSEQSFYRWRKRLMLSRDLPVQPEAPMFQRLEVLPSSAVLAAGSVRAPDAVLEVSSCHIRLPNGAALEVKGPLSTGLIGHWLQVVGAMPLMAERVGR